MIVKESHIIPEGIPEKSRISDYAFDVLKLFPSRKGIKKAIKRGELRLDGEFVETGRYVSAGQVIEFIDLETKAPKEYRMVLEVVYEDDYFAVINKPPGIEVNGNKFKTIENALHGNIAISNQPDALKYPRPVHRLDFPTSGLLIIAKTIAAQVELGKQFQNRKISKRYRAIVMGNPGEVGKIETPVDGRNAISEFKTIKVVPSLKSQTLSLVDLFPHTGRKHQLRVHMASIGNPILGDALYGEEGHILKGKGLFLCATELFFMHPIHETEIHLIIEEPEKFKATLSREEKRWNKFNSGNEITTDKA